MQLNPAAVRQTLFALLSAIEMDLRFVIAFRVKNQPLAKPLFSDDLHDRIEERKKKARNSDGQGSSCDELEYLDFLDHFEILSRHRDVLTSETFGDLDSLLPKTKVLAQIRNRVMHSRPLEPHDFAFT